MGLPNVECDKKATFGSNPNNFAIRTHDFETFTSLSADGSSVTFVSATRTVCPFYISVVIRKMSSPGLASTTFLIFSIDAA